MTAHYPFALPPLPYARDALEPHLDARTVSIHHDRHFAAYIDRLNRLLAPYEAYHSWPLPKLLLCREELPDAIRLGVCRNAGGVYNHDLYFATLTPASSPGPAPVLEEALIRDFGSMEDFRAALHAAALDVFGSGYAWLCVDGRGRLSVVKTANQDTPLPLYPLLCSDLWEHAYYLRYQYRKGEYFDNWYALVNWQAVVERLARGLGQTDVAPGP